MKKNLKILNLFKIMKMIKKFNGKKALKENCRKINNKYYEKNVDCFQMNDGKWHRINNGKIVFDHELKKAFFISEAPPLIKGIVDFDKSTESIVFGEFSTNVYNNVNLVVRSSSELIYKEAETTKITCINEKIASELGYKRNSKSDDWTFNGDLSSDSIPNAEHYNYTCDSQLPLAINLFNKYKEVSKIKNKLPMKLKTKFTYGYEIETSSGSGVISTNDCNKYGLIRLKDGSLRSAASNVLSFEYATVPYTIEDAYEFIPKICKKLNNDCKFDNSCSLHLHIGNFNATLINCVALWVLIRKIQNEMFEMFPAYKKNPTLIGKSKNYCAELPDIGIESVLKKNKSVSLMFKIKPLYASLFKFLSGGQELSDSFNRQTLRHPQSRKWNINTRYYIVNLVSLIFSRNKTVEFRVHTPTFNSDKIMNWTYICSAILSYVEQNASRIISNLDAKYSMSEIVNSSYSNQMSNKLISYIEYRKYLYKKAFETNREMDYLVEYKDDYKNLNNNIKI